MQNRWHAAGPRERSADRRGGGSSSPAGVCKPAGSWAQIQRGTVPSLPQSPLQELLLSRISQQIPKGLDRTSLAV